MKQSKKWSELKDNVKSSISALWDIPANTDNLYVNAEGQPYIQTKLGREMVMPLNVIDDFHQLSRRN